MPHNSCCFHAPARTEIALLVAALFAVTACQMTPARPRSLVL